MLKACISITLGSLIALALLALGGCASTVPVPELARDRADSAIRSASAADAAHFAPVELALAEEKLAQAKGLIEARKYRDAQRLLDRAQHDAELAQHKSEAAQARETLRKREAEIISLRLRLLGKRGAR